MMVAISRDGRIIYEGAFGYADVEGKVPATFKRSDTVDISSPPRNWDRRSPRFLPSDGRRAPQQSTNGPQAA
jgi:hypothetical protein